MKKTYIAISLIATVLLTAGALIPLGSYVPTKGVCPSSDPPVVRLHLIKGDSLQKAKADDVEPGPTEGCIIQTRYVLYAL